MANCLNHLRVDECRWKRDRSSLFCGRMHGLLVLALQLPVLATERREEKTSEQNVITHKLMSWSIS